MYILFSEKFIFFIWFYFKIQKSEILLFQRILEKQKNNYNIVIIPFQHIQD